MLNVEPSSGEFTRGVNLMNQIWLVMIAMTLDNRKWCLDVDCFIFVCCLAG